MKSYAEHVASLKATREEQTKAMKAAMQPSMDEGRSLNTAEQEAYDTAKGIVGKLDADIARFSEMAAIEEAEKNLQPVDQAKSFSTGLAPAPDGVQIKQTEKLEPGIAAARYAMCLVKAKGNHALAFQFAERHYSKTEAVVKTLKAQAEGANISELRQTKAAVPAGTTTDATWAAPLVYADTWAGDFINFLRPRTLIGQAGFRPVPFNVRIAGATSGGTAYWVGQGKAKPVTKFDFNATTVPFTKLAAITVITEELARFSDPSAEALIRDMLADAVIAEVDNKLFSADAAVANVSPAGLLNGVTPVAGPTDLDEEAIRCALLRLWLAWDNTNLGARPAYYTTPAVARALATLTNALGQPVYPTMGMNGGTLGGVPVRVSQYLANEGGSGGAPLILVDESEIFLADDGNVTLDTSQEASIQMDDAPTNSSSTTVTPTTLVSMWQTNSIAMRAERFIWWGPRRSGAIQWIDGFPTQC